MDYDVGAKEKKRNEPHVYYSVDYVLQKRFYSYYDVSRWSILVLHPTSQYTGDVDRSDTPYIPQRTPAFRIDLADFLRYTDFWTHEAVTRPVLVPIPCFSYIVPGLFPSRPESVGRLENDRVQAKISIMQKHFLKSYPNKLKTTAVGSSTELISGPSHKQ